MRQKRSLDGNLHKPAKKKTCRSNGTKTRKQIRKKKTKNVNTSKKIKKHETIFVGIDLHKAFLQVAVINNNGELLHNKRVESNTKSIKTEFSSYPKDAKYVLESSSVWYGVYRFMTDSLNLDVVLSNPYQTRLIAESKKKTDKVDAKILAEMLRGGYIATCYVPDAKTVEDRQLVRHRSKLVRQRARFKNLIHAILLQNSIKIQGKPFTIRYTQQLYKLKDWKIDSYLKIISFLNGMILSADVRLTNAVRNNKSALLLTSIVGIGNFTALTIASEIGDISRFSSPDRLVSYMGLAPSVRGSADMVHYGSITRRGSTMVRWVLSEAIISHITIKKDDKSSVIVKFYNQVRARRGSSKAKTAASAKLLRIVYWMLTKGIDYDACIREGRKYQKEINSRHVKKPRKKKKITK